MIVFFYQLCIERSFKENHMFLLIISAVSQFGDKRHFKEILSFDVASFSWQFSSDNPNLTDSGHYLGRCNFSCYKDHLDWHSLVVAHPHLRQIFFPHIVAKPNSCIFEIMFQMVVYVRCNIGTFGTSWWRKGTFPDALKLQTFIIVIVTFSAFIKC